MDKYYSIEDMTKIFNVSRQTVSRWIKDEKIKSIRINRKVFIPKDQFEKIERGN